MSSGPEPQIPPAAYASTAAPVGPWSPPQARTVPGPLASWGSRAAATMIDGVIILLPFCVLGGVAVAMIDNNRAASYPSYSSSSSSDPMLLMILLGIGGLAFLAVSFLYAPLLMARDGAKNGQTWGREMVGIRAVRDNGQPWDFGTALLREFVVKGLAVSVVSSIVPFVPWILNYGWPLWDRENRAVHDIVVSSHVIRA